MNIFFILSICFIILCFSSIPCNSLSSSSTSSAPPKHVVVLILSSRGYSEIIGNEDAPFINSLVPRGVLLSDYHGMDDHATQPNYLYLFSGASQNVRADIFPDPGAPFSKDTLASRFSGSLSFAQQCESLPSPGFSAAGQPPYAAWHNAVASFNLSAAQAAAASVPFDQRQFNLESNPDFASLPTLTFVVPNLLNDMSNASLVAQGDRWVRNNLADFIDHAASPKNRALFVLTFDCQLSQSGGGGPNHVAALLVGAVVRPGQVVSSSLTHLSLLQMLLRMYSLPQLGSSASAKPMPSSAFVSSYTLPPIPSSSSSSGHAGSSKPDGMRGVVVFIIVVFSLAGFLLAAFFSVFFYRKWKKSTGVEIIGQADPSSLVPTVE